MAGEELNIRKSFTIDTTSQQISEEQFPDTAQRLQFSIINTSAAGQLISLAFGEEAQAGSGIVLDKGGFYSESTDGIRNATNQRINVISSAAGGTIAYAERIMIRRF
jgi:hypothetical protein